MGTLGVTGATATPNEDSGGTDIENLLRPVTGNYQTLQPHDKCEYSDDHLNKVMIQTVLTDED